MNLFARDNTNDGAGWDVRVSHLVQTADYGYSQRFANFPDEIMPPLGAYGQGGGTGALFLDDERWPEPYHGSLLTSDWGRSQVYRHDLQPAGATFRATQEVFLNIPRLPSWWNRSSSRAQDRPGLRGLQFRNGRRPCLFGVHRQ